MECMQKYEEILKTCPNTTRTLFRTDEREWFTLQKCLDNVFTESHVDSGDVKKGSALMCPLGEFNT